MELSHHWSQTNEPDIKLCRMTHRTALTCRGIFRGLQLQNDRNCVFVTQQNSGFSARRFNVEDLVASSGEEAKVFALFEPSKLKPHGCKVHLSIFPRWRGCGRGQQEFRRWAESRDTPARLRFQSGWFLASDLHLYRGSSRLHL